MIWIIVLFACPPQGGECKKLGEYPGRFAEESYCEKIADTYRQRGEGDRWMTAPGWTPLIHCQHLPTRDDRGT